MFSVEFTAYAGIGAGAKLSFNSEGVSLCGEVGFGVGGGLEVNPFADIEKDGNTLKAEAGVAFGPAGLGGEISLDDCGRIGKKFKGNFGPFQIDTEEGLVIGGEPDDLDKSLLDNILPVDESGNPEPLKFKPEAKVAGEVCRAWAF
jgi:hypothetical protein